MIHFEEHVVINRPPQEVWEYASNIDHLPEWMKDMTGLRKLTEGPLQVGPRIVDLRKVMGRNTETTMEFTQYDPPHKFAAKALDGPLAVEFTHRFEPVGDGTQVTTEMVGQMRGILRLADPLIGRWMKGIVVEELNNLKNVLEGRA